MLQFLTTRQRIPLHRFRRVRFISTVSLSPDESNTTATTTKRRNQRVILSGIQPTGVPHLGNYLGALSNWVTLQKQNSPHTSSSASTLASDENDKLLFSIVGWHALTLRTQSPAELAESRMDMLAVLLAIGIDPKKSVVFFQEHNPNHTELAWILNCLTPIGRLRRMTTWKSRLATSRNVEDPSADDIEETGLNAGLFTYPVLQAADILVYKATHVPVGDDQTQHLELCRDIADQFNRTFKSKERFFPLPIQMNTPTPRILSLRNPSQKMSKSSPDSNSRILLTDTLPDIQAKIQKAVTDSIEGVSYDPIGRPGVSNLLRILGGCRRAFKVQSMSHYSSRYIDDAQGAIEEDVGDEDAYLHTLASQYPHIKQLKLDVTHAINQLLSFPRVEYHKIREDRSYLMEVTKEGAIKARESSERVMEGVRERVGLI